MKTIQKLLAGWLFILIFQPLFAQNLMVIHQGNGTKIQLPLESIDSIRFATLPPPIRQRIFQNNGNILSLSVTDIDSITYDLPNTQNLPQVSTEQVVALSSSSVYAQGSVQTEGSSAVTKRGFCWSQQPMPSIANNFTVNGSGTGSFGASIAPLQAGTLYFVRAYATNASGTAYGSQIQVSTQSPAGGGNLASISTNQVQYAPHMGLTAICGGNVPADGGLAVTARGVCWAAGTTPTLNHNFTVDGAGAGSFTSNLTGLQPNTQYFVRAYATNDAGTVYGVSYAFTTVNLPTVITLPPTLANSCNSAQCGGSIYSDGGSYISARGVCWSTSQNPTINLQTMIFNGVGAGSFDSIISGFSPATTYYFRAFATNSAGTAYGNQVSFSLGGALLPTVSTIAAFFITTSSATSGGNISSGGCILDRGVCWSTSPNPTIALPTKTSDGVGGGSFSSSLSGLSSNTTYFVRAYATNSTGTGYGDQISFTTYTDAWLNDLIIIKPVNPTNNPLVDSLVLNLVGNGVTVSNIRSNLTENSRALATFRADPLLLGGIRSGLMMVTGVADTMDGINNDSIISRPIPASDTVTGCSEGRQMLNRVLASNSTVTRRATDCATIQFDFMPTTNTIRFNYVFASEEYNTFVCSNFNDIFGFFIKGPGIVGDQNLAPVFPGTKNIALIPGTNLPVSINTVNNGTAGSGNPSNCDFTPQGIAAYIDNTMAAGVIPLTYYNLRFNGLTRKLQAVVQVIPLQTYTLTLTISDVTDGLYDSGVFIEFGSLGN